jgi:hypothetical protein
MCKCAAQIAESEARLIELEPYRTFVERVRTRMQREEQGRFENLSPSVRVPYLYHARTLSRQRENKWRWQKRTYHLQDTAQQ